MELVLRPLGDERIGQQQIVDREHRRPLLRFAHGGQTRLGHGQTPRKQPVLLRQREVVLDAADGSVDRPRDGTRAREYLCLSIGRRRGVTIQCHRLQQQKQQHYIRAFYELEESVHRPLSNVMASGVGTRRAIAAVRIGRSAEARRRSRRICRDVISSGTRSCLCSSKRYPYRGQWRAADLRLHERADPISRSDAGRDPLSGHRRRPDRCRS